MRFPAAIIFLLSSFAPAGQGQGILQVPGDHSTIQSAIQAAGPGDEIHVAPGVYFEHDIDFLGKAVTVQGVAGAASTILDAQTLGRHFSLTSGEGPGSVIRGLTLINGRAADDTSLLFRSGGSIFCNGTSPTITHCVFEGNAAGNAIATSLPFPQEGGGGGAVFVFGGSPTILNCVFSNNHTGVGAFSPILQVTGPAGRGGAIAVSGTTSFPVMFPSHPVIGSCTFVGNGTTGPNGDGEGSALDLVSGGGTLSVLNSIVHGNVPATRNGLANQIVGATDVQSSLVENLPVLPGANNFTADPLLVDAAGGDYHITAASPCRDVGDAGLLMGLVTDFEGDARVIGSGVDVGADEFDCLPGSGEDLAFESLVNGAGVPGNCFKPAHVGDALSLAIDSPGGTFHGTLVLLVVQGVAPGQMIAPISGFPAVHVNPNTQPIAVLGVFGLLPGGIALSGAIPPPAGLALRFQAFASAPFAANGIMAASDAHEIEIQP